MATSLLRTVLCTWALVGCVTATEGPPDPMDPMDPSGPGEPGEPGDPAKPNPGETLAQAAERVIGEWQRCMELSDFQAAGMAPAWSSLRTQNGLTCAGCHATGTGGFIATAQVETFFNAIRQDKYMLLQFVTADLTQGAAAANVIINQQSFSAVSSGLAPHAEHPRFTNPENAGMTALRAFYNSTQQRVTSGQCVPLT